MTIEKLPWLVAKYIPAKIQNGPDSLRKLDEPLQDAHINVYKDETWELSAVLDAKKTSLLIYYVHFYKIHFKPSM